MNMEESSSVKADSINYLAIDVCYEMICDMLNESAIEVEGSASSLSDHFRSLAGSAADQARILDQVVQTANQLEHKDGHVTLDAFIHTMSANITDTIDKIISISENAMSLSFVMESVVEQLAGIEKFIGEVNKINSQTRMLALNATIEAARAGSVGAGFGVVANEVKQVSKQIDGMASAMRTQINSISKSLQQGQETLGKAAGVDMSSNIASRAELDLLMQALLNKNNHLSEIMQNSAQSVKAISSDIGRITIGVQFQDRNSQIVSNVISLIRAMRAHEKNPAANPLPADPAAAVEAISSTVNLSLIRQRLFAVASKRGIVIESALGSEATDAAASSSGDEIELF